MAVVRELRPILCDAIEATLREVGKEYAETQVIYNLEAIVHLLGEEPVEEVDEDEDAEVDEHDDEHVLILRHQMYWRVHLFVQTGNRFVQCQGAIPYEACTTGDITRLVEMVRNMWDQQVFASLMMDDDLSASLDEIAASHDGGGG
jgi:hypothetical protein